MPPELHVSLLRKRGQRDALEGLASSGCTVQMDVHLPFS
jgi:hypothetical protein